MSSNPLSECFQFLDGRVTYRQIDYWLRTHAITLAGDASGSGSRRSITDTERDALLALIDIRDAANNTLEAIRNGSAWRDLMARERTA